MVYNNDQIKELRETFARRLKNARKMRGLSISELAKRLDNAVSSTAIEKYEKAVMFPQSSSILIALAEQLQVPMGDLLRPITKQINIPDFEFRKKSGLGKKDKEKILMKVNRSIEKYFEIEEIANTRIPYTLGRTSYVVDTPEKARQAAMEVRKEWGLGNQPIALPFILLEEHGVKLIEIDEELKLLDGTSGTIEGTPIVVINKRQIDNRDDEERRRFTTFHEFGHQYMLLPEDIDSKKKEELCNVFANEMLIPSDVFKKMVGEKRKNIYPVELRNIQGLYGISGRALMMKARQLDIINESAFRWFCISISKNAKYREYVDACILTQSHTTRFEQMVIRTLDAELITESKAAELLGLTTAQLHDKLNIA